MRKRFFLGLGVVIILIWGPMWAWSHLDTIDSSLHAVLRIALIAGIALGGYLLWGIVMRTLLGHDDE